MLLNTTLKSKWVKFCAALLICQFFPLQTRGGELLRPGIYGGVQYSTYTVEIPEVMWAALQTFNPDFRIWDIEDFVPSILSRYELKKNRCPQAIFGEFNGDLTGDVVLWGHDKKNTLLIAILSYQDKNMAYHHKVHVIEKGPAIENPRELPCSSTKGLG